MLLVQIHRYSWQRSQKQPCVGRFGLWSWRSGNNSCSGYHIFWANIKHLQLYRSLSLSRVLFLSGLSVCLLAAFWSLLCFICALCALCDAPHIHNNDRKDVALHVDHHYGRNLSHAKPIAWSDVFYGLLVPVWHTQIWRSNGTGNAKIAKVWTKHRQHSLRFGNRKISSRFGQNEIMRDKESCEDQFG